VPEELEQTSSKSFDVQYLLGVARRRHFHFLIPLLIGWMVVWCASWILPPRYKSATLILVEQPTMPTNYVMPNINDDLQGRLQTITQQILSRTRLLQIIDQFNLYSDPHGNRSPDDKVANMRKDIDVELVRSPGNVITAFNVYYSSTDAIVAQKVTGEITKLFINENLEVRQHQSEDTTKFLESQLENARRSLFEQEEKIRQFKVSHIGEMPAQLASNLQILGGLQSQLQNAEDSLNAARQQHGYLQTQVGQYRSLRGPAKSGNDTTIGLPAVERELEKLKAQLADLSSHYTDRHPDVRKLKQQIAKTERTRDQLLASIREEKSNATGHSTGIDPAPEESTDPSESAVLLQAQGQLRSNEVEITNRERSIVILKAKIDDYQARLNQEPIREQQLADLTRGYEQSKASYDELLKKKNESAMATRMELLQRGERFRIMDPPSLPQKPEFPNRMKFCGMGLGIGIALGVVVAGAFEKLDRRIHSEEEIKKLLPYDVLVDIPAIVNTADEQKAHSSMWLSWATGTVVFMIIFAGSAYSYLRG
jgi:succinoglycan biosynthesis transport protein ExoP